MTDTPASGRLHIVLLGYRNSGKSSLLNAIAGQQVAIVSDVPGTTTDHVAKAIELPGIGPCLLVDTAGLDDTGTLGGKRVRSSLDAVRSADIILAVIDPAAGGSCTIRESLASVQAIPIINKIDLGVPDGLAEQVEKDWGRKPVLASAATGEGIGEIISAIRESIPEDWDARPLTEGVVNPGELAVLVMPQDSQAPKGRLILPQQQTIRELLNRGCRIVCCTTDRLAEALASLKEKPAAIITDSQDFAKVRSLTPDGVTLTSFSILLAASKGDFEYFKESARRIDTLTESSRVLIAEACTHVPASEDIGRVKIPRMLHARAGEGLRIDFASGRDFPSSLEGYDLVIHCGACMFNRRYVLSRVSQAREQGVPMTNYGIAIAYINKILSY